MEMTVTALKMWAMQRLILVGVPSLIQTLSLNSFNLEILEIAGASCLVGQVFGELGCLGYGRTKSFGSSLIMQYTIHQRSSRKYLTLSFLKLL